MERLTRFDEVADRHGFLVAYPDGLDHHWNDGRLPGDVDDVGFVAALVRELAARYPVEAWIVERGGHTWPGGFPYLPKLLVGATSRDFDASEEIWTFFEKHGRKPAPAP